MTSRRISNNAGSANSFLNAVDKPNKAETKIAKVIALSGKQKDFVQAIMSAVKQCLDDLGNYQKKLDSKSIDVTLGRIATLLDESRDSFAKTELEDMKKAILDEISTLTTSAAFKTFLLNQLSSLFNDYITKTDVEDLKDWLSKNFLASKASIDTEAQITTDKSEESKDEKTYKNKIVDSLEDIEEGDYKDSTNAQNFMTLQLYINKQFDVLNENMKNIPGQSGIMSKMFKAIGVGFSSTFNGITKLTKNVAKNISKTASIAKSLGKIAIGGIFKAISNVANKVGSVIKGIGNLGKKVGGAIASPFKKIGGFFSSLNPFKRSEQKAEDRKQKAKDKIIAVMAKVIDKIWKVIEPFVDKAVFFMGLVNKFVIVPIALLVMKVLFITAAIIALAVGLVIAVLWIKNKALQFWNYITSGELWEDIKAKITKAWEWTKDFGKWIWNKFIAFGKWYLKIWLRYMKFIWVDLPVWIGKKIAEFGVWLWDKLCEFGDWLYDTYIYPYIIEPFKRYIWEPIKQLWKEKVWPMIEPFIKSLTELKDKIVKAFSGWDSNKPIWENLKNIGGILKDTIVEWWNNSPFKTFYEQHLKPFVDSAKELFNKLKNLGSFIKDAIMSWWNGDSSLSDTLKNIGTTVWNTVKEWWNGDNVFRTTWEKLVDYLDDLLKPIVEWYEQSDLKKWIDKIIDFGKIVKDAVLSWWEDTALYKEIQNIQVIGFWEWFKDKCGSFIASFESVINMIKEIYDKTVGAVKKAVAKIKQVITGVDESKLAKNQHTENWGKIPDNIKNVNSVEEANKQIAYINSLLENGTIRSDEGKTFATKNIAYLKEKSKQLAAQQVQQATQPIKQIEQMKSETNVDLKKTSEEISKDIETKERQQKQFNASQSDKSDRILARIDSLDSEINKKLDDPLAVPVPYPMVYQKNLATMENN